jgi:hypothetical protein
MKRAMGRVARAMAMKKKRVMARRTAMVFLILLFLIPIVWGQPNKNSTKKG